MGRCEMQHMVQPQFWPVCDVDELWAGEMRMVSIKDTQVLLLRTNDGVVRAVQSRCPHQDVLLADGDFDGCSLICSAHLWEFDADSGRSINPDDARLALYPVEERNGTIYVAIDGISPFHSHA